MPDIESERFDQGLKYVGKYIEWMLTGRYVRIFKILYTSLAVTALVTLNFSQFVNLLFLGFIAREIYVVVLGSDDQESYMMKYSSD